jgi:uncharacterized protein (TIGR02145 family)
MKKIFACLLIVWISATANAQDTAEKAASIETFKAGGTPIAIPAPAKDMVEVGYDNREFMEVFVPTDNRLLAAFVLTTDMPRLTKRSDELEMSRYAMVQVPRRGEYMDCGTSEFKEVTDGAKETFGDVVNSSMKDVEDEFNRRMKSLDLEEATVSLGKPIQLGCLFSKTDAYGFGMIVPVSMAGKTEKMSMGGALLRVKSRILFIYLYAEYRDEDTIKWLRKTTEEWADAILKANNPGQDGNTVPAATPAAQSGKGDGKEVKTVTIGTQQWMAENLNAGSFRNGEAIPEAKTAEDWDAAYKNERAAWCYYGNDPNKGKEFGRLYNWYAVNDPRGLAPAGWHVPSDEEWSVLVNFLGGDNVAGPKMKATSGWKGDGSGNNSSGFAGLPGGHRYYKDAGFYHNGNVGFWWSSTKNDKWNAWYRALNTSYTLCARDNGGMNTGFSIRCVKDVQAGQEKGK